MSKDSTDSIFKSKVLGHPSGLFVLFFTEMWERFSFYGMRVLLINFLTMQLIGVNPGWEWSSVNAGTVYATYAGLLYLTPILGGMIADKLLGYRNSVAIGALIMTLGHGLMALETTGSFYGGLALLVIGTGFFKPNITSIISEMYKDVPEKKDGAFTIFYMGVNAGAFFGMMLCGYLAEKIGWSWGFGLAGIFMLLGLLQFWFAKPLFGNIGASPKEQDANSELGQAIEEANASKANEELLDNPLKKEIKQEEEFKRNPFTMRDKILTGLSAVFGLIFFLDGPLAVNELGIIPDSLTIYNGEDVVIPGNYTFILFALLFFFFPLIISRISRYEKKLRNRMIAFIIFAFFTVFFWMSFEQGASSLVIFARDFTDRILEGGAATAFLIIDLLLTFTPLVIITWVLILLWKQTRKEIPLSNYVLAFCFLLMWGLGIWKTNRDYNTNSYEVQYQAIGIQKSDDKGNLLFTDSGEPDFSFVPLSRAGMDTLSPSDVIQTKTDKMADYKTIEEGNIMMTFESGAFRYVDAETEERIKGQLAENEGYTSPIIDAQMTGKLESAQIEISVSWFSILNSFFIIVFASFFSKLWESKYNPPAAVKYGLGLIIMAIGFGILAFGSAGLGEGGEEVVRVSLIWLVLAYLFHTLGELCLSPVGLSYVSKLVPARMIAFMFGMWYLAIAIGNYAAGALGGMIEPIVHEYSMSVFFLIFTIVPLAAGVIVILLNPAIKKLMGGVK